jgi:hypothetical protein
MKMNITVYRKASTPHECSLISVRDQLNNQSIIHIIPNLLPLSFTRFTCFNSPTHFYLHDIKTFLHFLDEQPLIFAYIIPKIRLECIDRRTRDIRIERIFFLEMATINGLIRAFDFDGDRGLTRFADGNLFVVTFNRRTGKKNVLAVFPITWREELAM